MIVTGERSGARVELEDRPRLRADLVFAELTHKGKPRVIVKEPGTRLMFQIGPAAFQYLKLLDGTRSVGEAMDLVTCRLGKEAPAARQAMLSLTERLAAVQALEGLDEPEGKQPESPTRTQRFLSIVQKVNPLRIQFPVIDPTPVLRRLDRLVFPLFHPVAFVLVPLAVVGCGLLLALGNRNPLYSFATFQTFRGWPWIYPALFFTTVLHEMGHAFACRRNGGSVPRMGFLLYLVVFPGCYTDVSDAWLMPKGKRIAVSLGGVHVESILWCITVLVWHETRPFSPLNQATFILGMILALRITSNLIPFLRLDGYFILSDLLGIPNLRPKSFAFLVGLIPVLGRRYRHDLAVREHRLVLLSYGVASVVTTAAAMVFGFRWLLRMLAPWFPQGSYVPLAMAATAFGAPMLMSFLAFLWRHERAARERAEVQP